MKESFVVSVTVADLRKKPVDPEGKYIHDELQETQVLYNEELICEESAGEWCRIEAVEQKRIYGNNRCQGYPGWVRKGCVRRRINYEGFNIVTKEVKTMVYSEPSEKGEPLFPVLIGTRFYGKDEYKGYIQVLLAEGKRGWIEKKAIRITGDYIEKGEIRRQIVDTAELFLGTPYLWGGRSIYAPSDKNTKGVLRGVDCSGLTNLVYRVYNIDIPRNAHDQWLACEHIDYNSLAPGDLIFLSSTGDEDFIDHVMLYTGDEGFIEAPGTGLCVKASNIKEKFGISLDRLIDDNFVVDGRRIYFGSFLKKDGPKD
ncbi:MAG: C40 family peptidase [Syntrophorhabdaceae bacterium]|nr:C40 family peptidase [Syntrophorhabdaceae bacterium]